MRHFVQVVIAVIVSARGSSTHLYAQPSQASYQGELNRSGVPFSAMKFAIVSGTSTLGSNDGASTNGSQPHLTAVGQPERVQMRHTPERPMRLLDADTGLVLVSVHRQ